MDCELGSSLSNEGLGTFVHNLLPDSLHIDPCATTISPSPLLTQKTIWAYDYISSYQEQLEVTHCENEGYVDDSSDGEYTDEDNEVNPVEEVEEIDSLGNEDDFSGEHHAGLNQLLYRIYSSSIFVDASMLSRNGGGGRVNWELFRRFLQLVEANKQRNCASERFLDNLRSVRFLNRL